MRINRITLLALATIIAICASVAAIIMKKQDMLPWPEEKYQEPGIIERTTS